MDVDVECFDSAAAMVDGFDLVTPPFTCEGRLLYGALVSLAAWCACVCMGVQGVAVLPLADAALQVSANQAYLELEKEAWVL